jgi:hypothetical protein
VQCGTDAKASVESDILTFDTVQARLEGGLEVRATGLAAGISGFWQGGSVRGNTDFQCGHGVWVGITVDGTAFEPGGVFHLHEEAAPSPLFESTPDPIVVPQLGPLQAGGGRTFEFRNVAQAPRELLIAGIESGVTLQQCSFQGTSLTPTVVLEDVGGPIRIENCRFTGQGLGISDARDAVVLAGNRFELSSALLAGIGLDAASATLDDNIVTGDGFIGLALAVRGDAVVRRLVLDGDLGAVIEGGRVTLDDGAIAGVTQITGGRVQARRMIFSSVIAISGTGLLGLSDCDLATVQILDLNETGGLLNDPTGQGAIPEQVFSSIDFDNDDKHCADYPPPQYQEETGECLRSGVPPPR